MNLLTEELESNIPDEREADKCTEARISWHITITLRRPVRMGWENEDIETGTESETEGTGYKVPGRVFYGFGVLFPTWFI